MLKQSVNNEEITLDADYFVENYQDSWAMYAFGTNSRNERVRLVVAPTDDEREAIDAGNAELDFIDYSNPFVEVL